MILQKIVKFYDENGLDALINLLIKLNFTRISCGTFSDVFRHKKSKYIIKICVRGDQTLPRLTDNRFKKIKAYFIGYKYLSFDSKVGVQEYVTEYVLLDSLDKIRLKNFIKRVKGKHDIHIGNVGLLNNNLIIFDF